MIHVIEELFDKRRQKWWIEKFQKTYSGGVNPNINNLLDENMRIFVAKEYDKDLGYIRINSKRHHFTHMNGANVWNISDAYVKPVYRHKGVMDAMIKYVIDKCDVKMIHIELN